MVQPPNNNPPSVGACQPIAQRLGTDDWGLQRLLTLEGLDDAPSADIIERLAAARETRRANALADIAALDAPHLGLVP